MYAPESLVRLVDKHAADSKAKGVIMVQVRAREEPAES